MEDELSEPAGVSLTEHSDLNENSLLLRKQNRHTTMASDLGYVVRKVDNAIHWISDYPVDSMVCFVNTSPPDSDLSGG